MSFSNWNWITQRLATGGGPVTEEDVQFLIDSGVTHMIDLREAEDPTNPLIQQKLEYLHNPTADDGQPKPLEWFKISLEFALTPLLPMIKGRVYVHCDSGVNRGPSTAYCLLRALTGMFPVDVIALICRRRPIDLVGIRYADDADSALKQLGFIY